VIGTPHKPGIASTFVVGIKMRVLFKAGPIVGPIRPRGTDEDKPIALAAQEIPVNVNRLIFAYVQTTYIFHGTPPFSRSHELPSSAS
jgi:hypothetical protein